MPVAWTWFLLPQWSEVTVSFPVMLLWSHYSVSLSRCNNSTTTNMAVRLSLPSKVLIADAGSQWCASELSSISFVCYLFIKDFVKGNSEMTASHNNSKPAQIWIKSVPHVITFVSTLTYSCNSLLLPLDGGKQLQMFCVSKSVNE